MSRDPTDVIIAKQAVHGRFPRNAAITICADRKILDLKVCDPAMGAGAFLVEACRVLGVRLVAAWARWPDQRPVIPADEDEELHARRRVAQRCLYGVDRNPRAVDLARLSLWLATLARDHEFTFLDHALKCGDSLVGLTDGQIQSQHWDLGAGLPLFSGNPRNYLPWLQTVHEGAHGNADLVAHFFRRAFGLLRQHGSFGLIATNTIG